MERSVIKDIREIEMIIGDYIIKIQKYEKYINHTQMQIILYLIRHEGEDVCQKDLEIETHLKKASITGTLDSMEDKGIILRKQSEEDKRKNLIYLSEKTLNEKERIKKRIYEIEEKINNNISEEELNQFYLVIDKMKANLK